MAESSRSPTNPVTLRRRWWLQSTLMAKASSSPGQAVQLGSINYLLLLNAEQTYQRALFNLPQAQLGLCTLVSLAQAPN